MVGKSQITRTKFQISNLKLTSPVKTKSNCQRQSLGETEDGALFGFTGTGTNPDLFLLVDLSKDDGWRIGFAGMTADGLTARLADKAIWSVPHAGGKGFVFDNWTYFLPAK